MQCNPRLHFECLPLSTRTWQRPPSTCNLDASLNLTFTLSGISLSCVNSCRDIGPIKVDRSAAPEKASGDTSRNGAVTPKKVTEPLQLDTKLQDIRIAEQGPSSPAGSTCSGSMTPTGNCSGCTVDAVTVAMRLDCATGAYQLAFVYHSICLSLTHLSVIVSHRCCIASSSASIGFHKIQTRSGVRNQQDSGFKITGEQIDDDKGTKASIRVHAPP